MVYNEVSTLAICVSGAIGQVGPTSNFGRLYIILIENTNVVTEFEYRPIKMPLTSYFMLVTTRGQRSILCLTINPTRGQHHSNGTTLTASKYQKYVLIIIPEKDVEAVNGFNSVSLVQVRTINRSSLHVPLQTDWRCRTRTGLPIPWLH